MSGIQMKDEVAKGVAPGLMTQLKEATDEHHRRAEGRMLQREMLAGRLPRQVFAAYLGELLQIHRHLEQKLAELARDDTRIAAVFKQHQIREHDLVSDLEFHGYAPGATAEATQRLLDDFDDWAKASPAALLGVLYVLEGSMNGNRFIAQVLMRKWSLAPGPGLRYLDPYGEDQPEKWAWFRTVMDTQAFSPQEEGAILRAAQHTFDAIGAISDAVYELHDPTVRD